MLFTELLNFHNCQQASTYPSREAWIAADTWSLIDQCNAALKQLAMSNVLQPLWKAIHKKIHHDQATWLQQTGNTIQTHLNNDEPHEAWQLVKSMVSTPDPDHTTNTGRHTSHGIRILHSLHGAPITR